MSREDNNYLINNYCHPNKSGSKHMTKRIETRQSFFEKNPEESTEIEVSQYSSSNVSSNNKRENRLKSTHSSKSKTKLKLSIEIEASKTVEERLLEENKELKKTIAELKMLQFYQIDENKLKCLLLETDELKEKIHKLEKENEKLKLENDFLFRTNMELKKCHEYEGKGKNNFNCNEPQMLDRVRQMERKTQFACLDQVSSEKFSSSKEKLDPYKIRGGKRNLKEFSSLSRVQSDKILEGLKSQSKNKIKISNNNEKQDYLCFQ